jgi:hypothetical protein
MFMVPVRVLPSGSGGGSFLANLPLDFDKLAAGLRIAAVGGVNTSLMKLAAFAGVIGVLFLQNPHGPYAQSPDKNPLAKVKSLKCTFSVYASGNWKTGDPQGQIKTEDVVLEIEGIDAEEGTAQIVGAGAVHITALLTASSLHLLERSMAGNLTVTTVFAQPNARGKLRAVRSQHDYIQMNIPGFPSEPTVTQRYGECEAGK